VKKVVIVAAGVVFLGFAHLPATVVAHADTADDRFWAAVQQDGTASSFSSQPEAIAVGHGICSFFDKGYSYQNILLGVQRAQQITQSQAESLIGDALGIYCRGHLQDLIGQ
jgi:hypothetical protein